MFALRWLDYLCDIIPWLARSQYSELKEKGQETTAQGPAAVLGVQPMGVLKKTVRSQVKGKLFTLNQKFCLPTFMHQFAIDARQRLSLHTLCAAL